MQAISEHRRRKIEAERKAKSKRNEKIYSALTIIAGLIVVSVVLSLVPNAIDVMLENH